MLGKLMKYEIKATQRIFLPLYGLILVFALINKVFLTFNFNNRSGMAAVPFVITMCIYCILIAALFVMTLVVMIQRFQKNLLGDEGYLSFTLPVKAHSHLDSKMIVSLMWEVLSLIVSAVSIFLLAVNQYTAREFSRFCLQMGKFLSENGAMAYLVLIEFIVLVFIGILSEILQIYAAITVGNLSSKHKLLVGFGTFIGFGVVKQIVISIIMNAGHGFDDFDTMMKSTTVLQAVAGVFGIIILFCLVFNVAFYFFTNWMLSKKLNLE